MSWREWGIWPTHSLGLTWNQTAREWGIFEGIPPKSAPVMVLLLERPPVKACDKLLIAEPEICLRIFAVLEPKHQKNSRAYGARNQTF